MKKECKWPIWIGCFVLFAVLVLLVFVLVSVAEDDSDFDPAPLIGLTKEEVLELAFDQYRKSGDELYIIVQRINKNGKLGPLEGLSYKTLEDAKNDASLMSSDLWITGTRIKFNFLIYKKEEAFAFDFDDGKVVNVRKISLNR